MKSYDVTIKINPQQYFFTILFICEYFTNFNLGFVLTFDFKYSLE